MRRGAASLRPKVYFCYYQPFALGQSSHKRSQPIRTFKYLLVTPLTKSNRGKNYTKPNSRFFFHLTDVALVTEGRGAKCGKIRDEKEERRKGGSDGVKIIEERREGKVEKDRIKKLKVQKGNR